MNRSNTTEQIIAAAIKIHRRLGPGLLESGYEACLVYEPRKHRLHVQRQEAVPLVYESVKLECGFRADLIVNREVVVEIKCKDAIYPGSGAVTFLSSAARSPCRSAYQLPWAALKEGIKRMVNNCQDYLHVLRGSGWTEVTAEVGEKFR